MHVSVVSSSCCIRTHLVSILGHHGIDRHTHELRRDAFTSLVMPHREHSNVPSERSSAVDLQLADDHTDECIGLVDCL